MKLKLFCGVAFAALIVPGAAYAQSTSSTEFETTDVVVTGHRNTDVAGTKIPDSVKTKAVLTQTFIAHQTPGQSVDEIINQLPGVSFQNQDPYGSSGGRLTIRGFGPDRISQTIDGTPINDTGNYAIYSNQQIDPELIDQVNVNLGSTDIDAPTASASGSTVNYTTIIPTDTFGARLQGSYGDLDFFRVFGLVNTGVFTSFGTKAWISASHANNDNVFTNFGQIRKDAYNFKVYQPIGSNGDFVSISGNYNVNRNQNAPDFPLRYATAGTTPNVVPNRIPLTKDERFFDSPACMTDEAQAGVADTPNTCGTAYEQNVNPSNTGTLRINSRFTLAPGLVLTVDPTFQYVKANGGSYGVNGNEGISPAGLYGYVNGTYFYGRDLNGDGDTLDTVKLDHTSQTVTHRYTVNSALTYDISDSQRVRLAYSHDYGRHRQSGEGGLLQANGQPFDVFPINDPLTAGNGALVEKRNRKSYAILDQVSGEYRGQFLNGALTVDLGVRAPFFKRNLHQYCFTTSVTGNVTCVAGDAADSATYQASSPYAYGGTGVPTGAAVPQDRQYKYDKILPSAGATFKFGDAWSVYASYSKGLQVPGTDNLYSAFYYPQGVQSPQPEVTDNFDGGIRYTSSKVQAQVGPWYTLFTNRLASSYDPVLDQTVYRNLGKVDKYGVDGSIAYQPIRELSLYVYGSYLKSKIRDNVLAGTCNAGNVTYGTFGCNAVGDDSFYQTKGQREAGAPTYTFGGRVQGNFGPVEIGVQAKRTGPRYVNDQNTAIYSAADIGAATTALVYAAKAPAYTVVDLDARLGMSFLGLNDKTYLQLNVTNLFDELYIGNLSNPNTSYTSVPFVYVGPPRTVSATLNIAF